MTTTQTRRRGRPRRTAAVLAAGAAVAGAASVPAPAHAGAPPGCGDRPATRRALERMTGGDRLTGAIVRVDDPACGSWTAASGIADRRTGAPMRAGMRGRIGSITKSFTAVAVLQLAGEGRIALDAPVARYLPGLIDRNGYDGRTITVRSLLRHTSGLPDHMDTFPTTEDFRFRHFEPRELVDRALGLPRPEGTWHYSTTNYVIAGMIIEKVTGRTWADEVERRIIAPLRLRDTYWPGDETGIRGPHPRGYVRTTEDGTVRWKDYTEMNLSAGWAGGALISSTRDVSTFFGALLGGRLLPRNLLREMRETVDADPDRVWKDAKYGLGLIRTPLRRCGGDWWGHAGGIEGFSAFGGVAPGGRRVAVLFNDGANSLKEFDDQLALVDTALCEGGGRERK